MKSLVKYIIETLNNDTQKWLKQILDNTIKLSKSNKIEPLIVDVNQLNKPEKPFLYNDFFNNNIVKQIIGNNKLGFTVINQIIRNPKQYITDKEINGECYPYWYQNNDSILCIGLCIYDKNVSYIENYLSLYGIESSLIVDNSQDLNTAILNDFTKLIPKIGKYEGIAAKPLHPKMKAILQKIGFVPSKDNKEIFIYKI